MYYESPDRIVRTFFMLTFLYLMHETEGVYLDAGNAMDTGQPVSGTK